MAAFVALPVANSVGTALALVPASVMKYSASNTPSRSEQLLNRARRALRRGENRQALVALRQATYDAENDPRLWALYGGACAKAKRIAEAQFALGQALYFRQRQHDARRARSIQALLDRLDNMGRAA